ncbi:hypothetical protein O988_07550 [Pseudogymnoascus sp. VKM F-3808]|nr:hypothetical protein O988_07550 [Pseudogymnoascus sp. VKM F-3808]
MWRWEPCGTTDGPHSCARTSPSGLASGLARVQRLNEAISVPVTAQQGYEISQAVSCPIKARYQGAIPAQKRPSAFAPFDLRGINSLTTTEDVSKLC